MASPDRVPNGGDVSQLAALTALIHDLLDEFKALDKMLRGNGGKPGVMEQVRANRTAIEVLAEDMKALSVPTGDREKTARTRWRAVAEIAVAFAAVLGSVLGILQLTIGGG